jgi:hypothetical protein
MSALQIIQSNCARSVQPIKSVQTWASESILKPVSRKRLLLKLSSALKIARDHQANGLPAGSSEYAQIHTQCLLLVDDFAAKWNLDKQQLLVQLPALGALERMTRTSLRNNSSSPKVALVAIALVALPVMAGVTTGLYSSVHAHIIRWLGGQ